MMIYIVHYLGVCVTVHQLDKGLKHSNRVSQEIGMGCVQSANSDGCAVGLIVAVRLRLEDPKFKFKFSIYKQ
jgi:hypothetical protein